MLAVGDQKQCSHCRAVQPLDAFQKDSSRSDGLQPWCRTCVKAYSEQRREAKLAQQAAWYQRNRERLIAKVCQRQREHPQEANARSRRAYQRHHDKKLTYHAEYRAQHREEVRARSRTSRAKKPAYYQAQSKRWREQNPLLIAEYAQERRAKLRGAKIEHIDRQAIYERDRGKCHICGKPVDRRSFSLDHLIPLSKGGEHSYRNLALAHVRCNSRRGAGALPAQLRLLG